MKRIADLMSPESTVSLFELARYLDSQGWKERSASSGRLRLFSRAESPDESLEIALPKSDDLIDSGRLKVDALNVLAQLHDREIGVVAAEVAGYTRDSQQFRVLEVDESEHLPLELAQHYIKGLKNLFLYGACSEMKPKPFFDQPLPSATDNLQAFRFGHTFRGSFGFTVFSHAVQQNQTLDMLSPKSLPRRVNERVARGLKLLQQAVSTEDADVLTNSYESAFNAKMCDALVEMIGEGSARFACSFAWASAVPASEELINLPAFILGGAEAEMLEYVAGRLKEVEPEEQSFVGLVTNLHCPKNPGEERSRRVVAIKGKHPEHGTLDVYVDLGPRRYLTAIDAHKVGASIQVVGKLARKGTRWSMTDIKKLVVVDA